MPVFLHASEDLKYNYEHDSLGDKFDASGDVTFRFYDDKKHYL